MENLFLFRKRLTMCQALLSFGLSAPPILHAQDVNMIAGRVRNTTGTPIVNVVVGVVNTYYSAITNAEGRFELFLPNGEWKLTFSRIGLRADTILLLVQPGRSREPLDIRLQPIPVGLEGLTIAASDAPPLARTVTARTVREVPPLGEPDIFRALVLQPLVSQPNDLIGRIHLAGGASDETGVRLDGHPVSQPLHALGLLGAFNVASIERTDVRIHHVPPRWGGKLSGVIDLETRRASAGTSASEAIVSLLSASYTTIQPALPGGLDVLLSGRITYADKVIAALKRLGAIGDETDIPLLGYQDMLVRIGKDWANRGRLELLAFRTRDRFVDSDLSKIDGYEALNWGETLVGMTYERSDGPWRINVRGSLSRAGTWLDERAALGADVIENNEERISAAVRVGRLWTHDRIRLGVGLDRSRHSHFWRAEGLVDELFSTVVPGVYRGMADRTAVYAFSQYSGRIGSGVSVDAGVRLTMSNNNLHPAPRFRVTWHARENFSVHAAFNRRFQFDALAAEPKEGSIRPPGFILRSPRLVDAAALAMEWASPDMPLGAQGTVRLDAFFKRYPDRTSIATNLPGLGADTFPDFRRVRGRVRGSSMSARIHWDGNWLIQGSYTYQRVTEKIDDKWVPTLWDSPHTLTLFLNAPVFETWDVNVAFHARSGRAATPVEARIFAPPADWFPNALDPRYLRGARHSIRLPSYRRLDIAVRHDFEAWGADWTLFAQALNVFYHSNPIGFNWRTYFSDVRQIQIGGELPGGPDPGRGGLPLVPSVGVEVRW